MLNLASQTSPAWVERAVDQLDAVLIDHAHCEKKAAGAALRLLFRYPEHRFLQEPLAALAREELAHFTRVLQLLEARGVAFGRQRPSAYAGRLRSLVRTHEPAHLVDQLLVASLIESRSCERFGLLAQALGDAPAGRLYGELLASEARHHGLYVGLAEQLAPGAEVRERLRALARAEARIVAQPGPAARLHA